MRALRRVWLILGNPSFIGYLTLPFVLSEAPTTTGYTHPDKPLSVFCR